MIRMPILTRMLALETAAGDWFSKLSDKEQQTYINAHPRSKFGKMNQRQLNTHLSKQAMSFATKHADKAILHENRSLRSRHAIDEKRHANISKLHENAVDHFLAAAKHYKAGRHREAQAALKKGHKFAARVKTRFGSGPAQPKISAAIPSAGRRGKPGGLADTLDSLKRDGVSDRQLQRDLTGESDLPRRKKVAKLATESTPDAPRYTTTAKRAGYFLKADGSNVGMLKRRYNPKAPGGYHWEAIHRDGTKVGRAKDTNGAQELLKAYHDKKRSEAPARPTKPRGSVHGDVLNYIGGLGF